MTDGIAISIGVANAGRRLAPLPGAIVDATRFAAWAKANNYRVMLVTDEAEPVTIRQLSGIVRAAVDATPERLLIFYSGHGTFSAIGDFWLLSGSDDDSNEAVNVNLSLLNAKRQPLRQIAVFADACRSTVDDPATIGGSSIFPRTTQRGNSPEWDHFFATAAGSIAQETGGGDPAQAYGVFSKCLFEALDVETQDAVEKRAETGRDQWVVSSGRLARWLRDTVPLRTGEIPGAVVQFPDVQGGWIRPNDVYLEVPPERMATPDFMKLDPEETAILYPVPLGVRPSDPLEPRKPSPPQRGELNVDFGVAYRDGARRLRLEALRRRARREAAGASRVRKAEIAIEDATARNDGRLVVIRDDPGGDSGLRVNAGGVLRVATATAGPPVGRTRDRDGELVSGEGDDPQTIALQLDDGRWFATVILPGFVGIASIADGGVIGLSYQTRREPASPEHEEMFRRWTALMSNGEAPPDEFEDAAEKIRMFKHVNPALGILAAYAYERAGNLRGVDSIIGYFASKGQPVPFDIAMLSTYELRREAGRAVFAKSVRHGSATFKDCAIAGSFPLMNRGWSMLDPADPGVHPGLLGLRAGLQPSLWTMFDAPHGQRLAQLIEAGEL